MLTQALGVELDGVVKIGLLRVGRTNATESFGNQLVVGTELKQVWPD